MWNSLSRSAENPIKNVGLRDSLFPIKYIERWGIKDHVNVRECIDPFTKLDLESEFQALSQGGCISYIETANLQNNIPAVLDVIKHIYDHIMYAELNCKSDYCQVCGSSDEIQIVEKDGKHIWRCRHCGNEDQTKMNVARRTCGLTI